MNMTLMRVGGEKEREREREWGHKVLFKKMKQSSAEHESRAEQTVMKFNDLI